MTTNKEKKQGNDKLFLRFDRVDQLQKQLDEITEVIKSTNDFSYLDDFRNTVIMGLSRLTNNQRNKINTLFSESGIFKLITDRRKELMKKRVLARKNQSPKAFSNKTITKKRGNYSKPKPSPKKPIEIRPIEGNEVSYRNNDLVIKVIHGQTKKGKQIVQITEIENIIGSKVPCKLDKVTVGNVYEIDTLPQSLRFVMFPEQEAAYLSELREKEIEKKVYRDMQSKLHKGNEQSKKSNDKKQGGRKGKRAA